MKNDAKLRKNLVERIYLTNEEFVEMERRVLLQEHLKRYGSVRRFCYGNVLDFACGCGYGTFMLAGNPDVSSVTGIDQDAGALTWAETHFSHPKISYKKTDIEKCKTKFDTLVCLETIEHIVDKMLVPRLVERCHIDNVIVSFPDKKTTHYNPHHKHDFVRQDILDLFPNHVVYHVIHYADSVSILLTRLPSKAPHDLFRNVRDL